MPKQPNFKPVNTATGWMISIPANMTAAGKRERKFFETEKEANRFASRMRAEYAKGSRGGVVDVALADMAIKAAEILEPWNITLVEAAKIVAKQMEEAQGTDETFAERLKRFTLDNEERWRPRYARDMARIPSWVGAEFMSMRCSTLTKTFIEAALVKFGARSEKTVHARFARVLAVVNAKKKRPRLGAPEIMTVNQCARMLRACRNKAEVRAVALLLFAGIRPDKLDGEITRLDWSNVGSDHITIVDATSKTHTDRLIPITPRLRRLLKGHPASGSVLPPNWQRRISHLRKLADILGKQDITRHTFASHFLAAFGEDDTKNAMGHAQNSRTLFKHYRHAVAKSVGVKYFS